MAFYVKVSGTWRPVKYVCEKVGGTWRYAKKLCLHANGGWHQPYPDFTPFSQVITTPGSQSIAIPFGASTLQIAALGGGSSGAVTFVSSIYGLGASGYGGAYGIKNMPIAPQDWGTNLSVNIGAGGAAVTNSSGSNIDGNAGGDTTVSASLINGTLNVNAHGGVSGKGGGVAGTLQAAATATGFDSAYNGGVPAISGDSTGTYSGGSQAGGPGVFKAVNTVGNGANGAGIGTGGAYGERGSSGSITSGAGVRGQLTLNWS